MSKINFKEIISFILGNKETGFSGSKNIPPSTSTTPPNLPTVPNQTNSTLNNKSQKIFLLKKSLEFDSIFSDKAQSAQTLKAFLLFIHQEFFFKIDTLHEIGVVSDQSHKAFQLVVSKSEELLSSKDNDAIDPVEVANENASLKRQLANLYKKHVKSDIICENELVLEEEKSKLQSRLDDLSERYKLSQKANSDYVTQIEKLEKIKAQYNLLFSKHTKQQTLLNDVETSTISIGELESKIRHLTAKVEHQDRLINALSYDNPTKTADIIKDISSENENLQFSIDDGNEDLKISIKEMLKRWPESSALAQQLTEVIDLCDSYKLQTIQLQETEKLTPTNNTSSSLEDLQSETDSLKSMNTLNEKIIKSLASVADNTSSEDKPNFNNCIRFITEKKEAVKQAIKQKQLKLASHTIDGEKKLLTERIANISSYNEKLSTLTENQNKIIMNLRTDRKLYQDNIAKFKEIVKENKRLNFELKTLHTETQNAQKIEQNLQSVKKEHYALQSSLNKQINYCKELEDKITKLELKNTTLNKENESLVAQYDKLFSDD